MIPILEAGSRRFDRSRWNQPVIFLIPTRLIVQIFARSTELPTFSDGLRKLKLGCETETPMVKLIAVDLDGTLFTSEGVVEPEGLDALRRASSNGVRIVVATARRFIPSDSTYRNLGFPDPIICWDGAETYHSHEREILDSRPIPLTVAREVLQLADTEDFLMSVGYSSALFWKRRPGQSGPPSGGITFTESYFETLKAGLPLRLLTDDVNALRILPELCSGFPDNSCRVQAYVDSSDTVRSLGIYSAGTSKGKALELVCEKLEIAPEDGMAIGDNWSDKPMLDFAGIGVIMGNAPADMKSRGEHVAPTNDDQGVRWAVEEFVVSA